MLILLVEDEINLGRTLSLAFSKLAFEVELHTTLKSARSYMAQGSKVPDLVVLDLTLPDGDGLDFCKELREGLKFENPILMLTARGSTEDKVKGLELGADDYLAKPFSFEELAARIKALTRRVKTTSADPLWSTEPSRLRVFGHRGWVELTPLEFKLASKLIDAKGAIVSRNDLLKEVWGFSFLPKTRTVDYFLGRLRKHFERDPENPKHFLTVRGAGYRFEI